MLDPALPHDDDCQAGQSEQGQLKSTRELRDLGRVKDRHGKKDQPDSEADSNDRCPSTSNPAEEIRKNIVSAHR